MNTFTQFIKSGLFDTKITRYENQNCHKMIFEMTNDDLLHVKNPLKHLFVQYQNDQNK